MTDCSRLDELALLMKDIHSRYSLDDSQTASIQRMDGYSPVIFYDFGDYVRTLCGDDAEQLTQFETLLEQVVPYKAHREIFHCGPRSVSYRALFRHHHLRTQHKQPGKFLLADFMVSGYALTIIFISPGYYQETQNSLHLQKPNPIFMNRRLLSVTVFLALMLTSLLAGRHNYHVTRNEITADLNQALALTLLEKKEPIVTQDTIRAYKQLRRTSRGQVLIAVSDERFCRHLKNRRLKETSFLTFDVVDKEYQGGSTDEQAIYSDTLMIRNGHAGETLALKGYTRLSAAAVFGMSDQRLPAGLMAAAILWAIGSMLYLRKREKENLVLQPVGEYGQSAEDGTQSAEDFGGLTYSDADDRFYGADHTPIRFTPMQQQLMRLFWQSPSHSISKEEICATLWPKKDDANDTLYTLIRRLKPIVEEHTQLKIVADRGRNYSLEINELKS